MIMEIMMSRRSLFMKIQHREVKLLIIIFNCKEDSVYLLLSSFFFYIYKNKIIHIKQKKNFFFQMRILTYYGINHSYSVSYFK